MRQIVALFALVVGCDRPTPHEAPIAAPRLEPGDRVVARIEAGFQEATVMAAWGKLVNLSTDGGSTLRLPRSWVTPLIFRDDSPVVDGEWRLCAAEEAWQLCRPERDLGGNLHLAWVTSDGARRLADSWTLEIPSGVRPWAIREGGHRLDRAILADTLPRLQPALTGSGFSVGDPVVARWNGSSWWDATLKERHGAQLVVAWADGSSPSTVTAAEVAPAPSVNAILDGKFALCRSGTNFAPALIAGIPGAQDVTFADGRVGQTSLADCIPARVR